MIRNILNRAKWHTGNLDSFEIIVTHRGAQDDRRAFAGGAIKRIMFSGIYVEDVHAEGQDTESYIPYHRFIEITNNGEVVWTSNREDAVKS